MLLLNKGFSDFEIGELMKIADFDFQFSVMLVVKILQKPYCWNRYNDQNRLSKRKQHKTTKKIFWQAILELYDFPMLIFRFSGISAKKKQ